MASMMDSLTKLGLFNGNMPNMTSTANGSSSLVDTILTTAGHSSPLVHLLLFVYRFLGIQTGLDPSAILTLGGILWGFQYLFFQAYNWVENFVERHLMCSIAVSQDDSIYYHIMEWMSKQPNLNNNRYLTAQTIWRSAWEEDEDSAEDGQSHLFWTDAGEGGQKYLNFSNHAARSVRGRWPQTRLLACDRCPGMRTQRMLTVYQVPRFVPAMGSTSFWHKKIRFRLYRKKESLVNSSGWQAMKDQEEIKISCYGRSISKRQSLDPCAEGGQDN